MAVAYDPDRGPVDEAVGPTRRRKSWVWCDDCGKPHPLWMTLDWAQLRGRTRAERLATWWQS
jgi:hypothetical protein